MAEQSASEFNTPSCDHAPMPRAVLRTLRNASGLEVGCSYTVNDFSRGCLAGLVTGITLTATAVNSLSMAADVNTTLDTVDWRGLYDLDAHRITHLEDNRGNKVWGRVGAEVDAFPWNKTNWYGNTVDNHTLTMPCDGLAVVTNTKFHKAGSTNLTGAVGYIRNSEYGTGAITDYRNVSSLRITSHVAKSRARFYASGALVVTKTNSSMKEDAYVTIVGAPDFVMSNSHMGSQSRIYSNGKVVRMYGFKLDSQGTARNLGDGELRFYYGRSGSYSEIRNEAGAGNYYLYGLEGNSRAYIRNYMSELNRSYYDTFIASGRATHRSTVALRTYYNVIASLASFNTSGTVSVVYGCEAHNYITQLNTTGGTHYSTTVANGYRLTTAFNTRYCHGTGRRTTTLTAANTSRYDHAATLGFI